MKSLLIIFSMLLPGSVASFAKQNEASTLDTKGTIYETTSETDVKTYYSSIQEGDKGEVLLSKLQKILSLDQQKMIYNSGSSKSATWDGYYLFERDWDLSPLEESELNGQYKKSGIWLNSLYENSPIYVENGINTNGKPYKYYDKNKNIVEGKTFVSSKAQFDREHVFPKSFGFNGSGDKYKDFTAGCDVQNLHLGEHVANSNAHSNLPYGDVKTNKKEYISGLTGEVCGYTGNDKNGYEVFEPLAKDKGNIARSIFYMVARYHTYEKITDKDESPALTLSNSATAQKTTEPIQTKDSPAAYGLLSDLIKWNKEDPVSDYEIRRNNLIYNAPTLQGNRNPFIDYPEWIDAIYDENTGKLLTTASENPGISFTKFSILSGRKESPLFEDEIVEPETNYNLTIKATDSFKKQYYLFETFDDSGIEVSYVDKENNTKVLSKDEYTLFIDGDKKVTTNYQLFGFNDVKLYAKATIEGKEYTTNNNLTFKITASTTQIIIFLVIAFVLIIILIIIPSMSRKRKKKLKKKDFENVTKKRKSNKKKEK